MRGSDYPGDGLVNSDPGTKRATRLALLVVLTVALPSLILTALGAVAVANEEAAARMRAKELYGPVGLRLVDRFDGWIRQTLKQDRSRLSDLATWARSQSRGLSQSPGKPPQHLEQNLAAARHAVNFFVIDEAGKVILPRGLQAGPESVERAIEAATPISGPPRCRPAQKELRARHEPEQKCALRLALAFAMEDDADWASVRRGCAGWTPEPDLDAIIELVSANPAPSPPETAETALRIIRGLTRPGQETPAWFSTLAARGLHALFREDPSDEGTRARHVLRTISERASLIRHLAARNRVFQPQEVTSAAVLVEDWRRLVVTGTFGKMVAGYELVPDLVADEIRSEQCENCLEDSIDFRLYINEPPEGWCLCLGEKKDQGIWSKLLRRTDLAWSLVLRPRGELGFWSLSHSRGGLYLWSLVLVGMALIGGIGHTLYAVAREARISRLKTDFVSSVSHDLRTPLTSIRMFTESLLLNRVKGDAQKQEYLEVIAQETERLSRLTERILDFSRMEAGRKAYAFEVENVAILVQHALRSCRPVITESNGQVEVDIPDDLPRVRGDHDALIEVLINLLTNALKYSDGRPEIRIRAESDGQGVALHISDKGIGISPQDQRRVFEKFHRVDCRRTSEVGGCGIGLSLVQHIVCAHGGSVSVSSQLGEGSTFSIRLPGCGSEEPLPSTLTLDSETMA